MASSTFTGSLRNQTQCPQPCRLLQLPDELKLAIVNQIDRRGDLYNFSLACRKLEDMTLGRLYKSVDLEFPASGCLQEMQDTLPTFRPYVLQNMRELAVRNGVSNVRNPIYRKRTRSDANSMEAYVGEIIKAVPQDRLKSFSFLNQKPMSSQMLDGLTKSHGKSLKHFQCCELELLDSPDFLLPTNLRSIECRSVLTGQAIAKLIALNKDSLTSLSLGQDKYLLQQYRQRRIGFLNNVAQPQQEFQTTLDLSSIPKLKHLSLSGLDLTSLIPQTQASALFLTQLQTLTIESCLNTSPFLDTLTQTFRHTHPTPPSLHTFLFRHELVTTPLRTSLLNFLTSFKTLTSLTLLVENSTFNSRPSTFLKPHTSLTQLTLESRIQPRDHLQIDTSRPFGCGMPQSRLWHNMLADIRTSCPSLSELGIALPWSDPSLDTQLHELTSGLPHLRTLHVRNFPSLQAQCTTSLNSTSTQAQTHATRLLTACITPTSSLELLAVGPTLYTSRWRLGQHKSQPQPHATTQPQTHAIPTTTNPTPPPSSPRQRFLASTAPKDANQLRAAKKPKTRNEYAPPEYLCTHYFDVVGGRVVATDERAVLEGRGGCGRGSDGGYGVFGAVWLR